MNELFTLAWPEFSSNISETFKDIRKYEELNDVTLVCDDGEIDAHKLILYSGSTFFQSVLSKVKHQHPLIYLKGVKINHLEAIVDFIYNGEVNIAQDDLKDLLETAEDLKVKGLSEKQTDKTTNKKDDSRKESEPGNIIEEPVLKLKDSNEKDDVDSSKDSNLEVLEMVKCELSEDDESEQLRSKNEKVSINQLNETKFEGEDIEEKVLGLMERMSELDGTHSWVCNLCKKTSHDKTRIRKHVKSKHLQKNEKDEKVEDKFTVSFKDGDCVFSSYEEFQTKVFNLMEKVEGENHRVTWFCKECNKSASDKTRIRKHVESHISGLVFSCIFCEAKRRGSNNMINHVSNAHTK